MHVTTRSASGPLGCSAAGAARPCDCPKSSSSKEKEVLVSRTEDGKVVLEARQPRRSSILAWLEANGPIEDFPGDPGSDDLLPRRL